MTKLLRCKYIYNIIFFVLVCILWVGCSKKQVEIQTTLPQTISDLIIDFEVNYPDCTCHPFINQYIWRNQNVYVLANNDALDIGYICDWIPIYYDSTGQQFTVETGYFYQDFLKDSRLAKEIWACK